jgi:hypothetical protein
MTSKPTTVHSSDEEMDDPLIANDRNFYKVEKWTRDGAKVDHMLYAGSSLAKAHEFFAAAVRHRPRIRLTIRQRTRVLQQWRASCTHRRRALRGGGQLCLYRPLSGDSASAFHSARAGTALWQRGSA